jgi:hypothetical protein
MLQSAEEIMEEFPEIESFVEVRIFLLINLSFSSFSGNIYFLCGMFLVFSKILEKYQ